MQNNEWSTLTKQISIVYCSKVIWEFQKVQWEIDDQWIGNNIHYVYAIMSVMVPDSDIRLDQPQL